MHLHPHSTQTLQVPLPRNLNCYPSSATAFIPFGKCFFFFPSNLKFPQLKNGNADTCTALEPRDVKHSIGARYYCVDDDEISFHTPLNYSGTSTLVSPLALPECTSSAITLQGTAVVSKCLWNSYINLTWWLEYSFLFESFQARKENLHSWKSSLADTLRSRAEQIISNE